jgi:transposase
MERAIIDEQYRGSGSAAYDPVCLLKMVLYQYLKGNLSPAAWYEEARRNDAVAGARLCPRSAHVV